MVFATATALAIMRWRHDYYLFILGAVAFAGATGGFLHRRLHRPGDTGHIVGMGVGYTVMLTAFDVETGRTCRCGITSRSSRSGSLPSVIAAPICRSGP